TRLRPAGVGAVGGMKLLIFDWHADGHHPIYMARAAEALLPRCRVAAAGAEVVLEGVSGLDVDLYSLGDARPEPVDRAEERDLSATEYSLLVRMLRASGADCVLHLYSDPVMPYLAQAPLDVRTVATVFYPCWHYPWTYGTSLPPRAAVKAWLLERAVRKWRSRNEALGIFALDDMAVRRWNRSSGAPAFWFPEPPVAQLDGVSTDARSGCVLYGALAARKGVDRLAAALARDSSGLHAVIAGSVDESYADELNGYVHVMRTGGARVDVRSWAHDERSGLELLARAQCAVLPYHRHVGMSRVLLEAAAVGTPVLVHDHGLIAALVQRHGIGLVVDCSDPRAFRRALRS